MRRIALVTGSRAEYGILKPLISKLASEKTIEFALHVTGSHLSKEHGYTIDEIEKDGFSVSAKVESITKDDTEASMSRAISQGIKGFTDLLVSNRPDILVVLGDRFEIFAAATASFCNRIPVAHLCGGEVTEGALDDGFRNAITKLSSLHFTTTNDHKQRVIQLGEDPERVFNVGELDLENLSQTKFLTKEELGKDLSISLNEPFYLFTLHPETLSPDSRAKELSEILQSLENKRVIFTGSNADSGGREINEALENFVSNSKGKANFFTSVGRLRYLSLMKLSKAVIGNSSSGIIEAPSLRIPTVNIGNRQLGRESAASVIHCEASRASLDEALNKVDLITNFSSPYEKDLSVQTVLNQLKTIPTSGLFNKKFYDLPL